MTGRTRAFNGAANSSLHEEACPYCGGTGKTKANPAMRFRALREREGLDQTAMANRVGLSRTQITNIEAGRGDPSLTVLMRASDEFKVSVDWLLGRAHSK